MNSSGLLQRSDGAVSGKSFSASRGLGIAFNNESWSDALISFCLLHAACPACPMSLSLTHSASFHLPASLWQLIVYAGGCFRGLSLRFMCSPLVLLQSTVILHPTVLNTHSAGCQYLFVHSAGCQYLFVHSAGCQYLFVHSAGCQYLRILCGITASVAVAASVTISAVLLSAHLWCCMSYTSIPLIEWVGQSSMQTC